MNWNRVREEGEHRGDATPIIRGPHPAGETGKIMLQVDTQEGMNRLASNYGMRVVVVLCDNPDVIIPSWMECVQIRDRRCWEREMRDRHYTLVKEEDVKKVWKF